MAKFIKFSPLLIAMIALSAVLVYLNLPQADTAQGGFRGGATPVVIEVINTQQMPVVIAALGTSKANESVTITAEQTERVTAVYFEDGDIVEANALLVDLNNKEEKARVNELNINLNEAKRQLNRFKGLAKESATSEQLLDEQRAKVEAISAQLDVANARLEQLQIRAPFSGQLGIREVSLGSLVRPGDMITNLDDLSLIKVDFSIAEKHFASVAEGQRVFASSAAYPGVQFDGVIDSIDSRVDPVTRSFVVRAIIPNEHNKLRPGMLLQVSLEKRVLNTLVVAEGAVVPQADKQFVYVVDEQNVAHKREVTIGQRQPGRVQVLEGLKQGEQVIVEGTLRVREGSKVEIVTQSEAS